MLAIRMQRTGRSGHAQFRMIVQDSHFHPTRGKVVAYLGNYDPHTKTAQIDKELASRYLSNGAQPSDRVAKLLKAEGVKLPDWVKLSAPQKREVRNPDKRRSTRPAEPEAPKEEAPAAEAETAEPTEDAGTEGPTPEEAQPEKSENASEEGPTPTESTPGGETEQSAETPVEEAPVEEPAPEEAPEKEPEAEPKADADDQAS